MNSEKHLFFGRKEEKGREAGRELYECSSFISGKREMEREGREGEKREEKKEEGRGP